MPNIFNILDRISSPRVETPFTSPAVGNSVTLTFPQTVEIYWFRFRLDASAIAGSRNIRFLVEDSLTGQNIFDTRSSLTVQASETRMTTFSPGLRDSAYVALRAYQPIPPKVLVAPLQQLVVFDTNNIDPAGDQFLYALNYAVIG